MRAGWSRARKPLPSPAEARGAPRDELAVCVLIKKDGNVRPCVVREPRQAGRTQFASSEECEQGTKPEV
jgi:hypothetical protein